MWETSVKALLFVVPALLLAGCATYGQRFDALQAGAPREQVLKTMEGCPSSTQKAGRYEAIVYNDRMPHFFQWSPATYTFILRDGVLVEFGEGTPRQTGVGDDATLELVPPVQRVAAAPSAGHSGDGRDRAKPSNLALANSCIAEG
jgi:hypothetical protein